VLYGLVARTARVAVVFRRGPSKLCRVLLWNLADDIIQGGQWFKGRIYERRCDLTPNGEGLVYFAASFRKPLYSWTAISRPPYLTALALWPKGDCWGGGGLFDKHNHLRLNHGPDAMKIADGFAFPHKLEVKPLGDHSGGGEDAPIMAMRLARHGWIEAAQAHETAFHKKNEAFLWTACPPVTRQRRLDRDSVGGLSLRTQLHAIGERQGRWYVETADVADSAGRILFDFGRIDWADLDHNGDVLYAKNGCLFRLANPSKIAGAAPVLVADLNGMTFEPMAAPDWAQSWS